MNPNNITPDDPRLTAYALDEMAPAERAEFAQLLQQDTAAQQAVAEIRATSSLLATALEHEPAFAEAPAGRPAGAKRGVLLRFPQLYYTVSGLAAACFAVAFVLWQNNHKPTQLIEVPLTAPVAGLEAGEAGEAKKADTEKREAKLQVTVDKSNRREQDARKVAGQEPPVAPSLAKTATLGDSQVAVVANEFKGSEAQVKEEGAMDLPVVPSPAPTPAVAYRMPQYQVAADMAATKTPMPMQSQSFAFICGASSRLPRSASRISSAAGAGRPRSSAVSPGRGNRGWCSCAALDAR